MGFKLRGLVLVSSISCKFRRISMYYTYSNLVEMIKRMIGTELAPKSVHAPFERFICCHSCWQKNMLNHGLI
jgi:hypothetical protein